jgi:hypothetical protein
VSAHPRSYVQSYADFRRPPAPAHLHLSRARSPPTATRHGAPHSHARARTIRSARSPPSSRSGSSAACRSATSRAARASASAGRAPRRSTTSGSSSTARTTTRTTRSRRASGRSASRSRTGCAPAALHAHAHALTPCLQRTTYIQSVSTREADPSFQTYARPYRAASGFSSAGSGHRTPKEANEERWAQEAEGAARPNKVEMREAYKELGGRKSKAKTKLGRAGGAAGRNVGGLGEEETDGY